MTTRMSMNAGVNWLRSRSGFGLVCGVCLALTGCVSTEGPSESADGSIVENPTNEASGAVGDAFKIDMEADNAGVEAAITEFEQFVDTEEGITPIDAGSDLPDVLPALDEDEVSSGNQFGEQGGAGGSGRPVWMSSGSEAILAAQNQELPLLVWMANSRSGAADRAIRDQVFATNEFRKMAGERFVGLKIDYGDQETRNSKYYQSFKDRYKPRGAPVVLLLRADGTEFARYRGYRSDASVKGWLQRLEADLEKLSESEERWIETLRRNGYRDWKDTQGRTFFGRLMSVEDDDVWFMDRYKRRYEVPLRRLSPADRAGILKANR
ncbi:hypothetical protein [Sulfuriroseicoccus oceanibius]|uniref:Uncharacterized protein n=1 Tax=Sulfuriroseicoccus oceanibius TaxID=2707525 RepID=A0A7T7F3U2_9BACT|nr:hypothetical protein [Sulfuriroseicoccus oceanibius]QQL46290.1 hypothetical protein G3M56_006875 [Sulfuriroseicoccus oceanibius]